LDAIEKAIRNAFEKGNAEDRAFREKVYRSAFAALDRALQANPGVTVETAIKRRKAMQAKIAEIESEFLPAVESVHSPDAGTAAPPVDADADGPAPSSAPIPSIEPPSAGTAQAAPAVDTGRPTASGRVEPTLGFEPQVVGPADMPPSDVPSPEPRVRIEPGMTQAPVLAGSPSPSATAEVRPDRDERRARRRFPAGAVLGLLLLAVVAAGVWWATQAGLFRMPEGSGQPSVAAEDGGGTPPSGEGAPQRSGESDQDRNWITVFTPSDPTHVSTPSDAKAEAMQDDSGAFLRIRSGKSGSAISFDVGEGVLQQLAGKHAVFDVVARSEEGKPTQLSIDCNFGEMGDCGRKRYAVGQQKNEYLFEVQFPDKRPGAAGSIAVNSDFDAEGRAVDIYQIRVSVDE